MDHGSNCLGEQRRDGVADLSERGVHRAAEHEAVRKGLQPRGRPWPLRITPASSISTGAVKPNRFMLATILVSCLSLRLRGLFDHGLRLSGAR